MPKRFSRIDFSLYIFDSASEKIVFAFYSSPAFQRPLNDRKGQFSGKIEFQGPAARDA
jgi:hypothetical protein